MERTSPPPSPSTSPRPRRRRWKLRLALIVVLLAIAGLVALLPSAAGLAPVRKLVLAKANEMVAPSKIEAGSLHASWFGSTRITGLRLIDPKGKCVVEAPSATLDRSLSQLLLDRPRYGTLTLYEATVDIERRADGSIDLAEALEPILTSDDPDSKSDPRTDFTLKVARGKLLLKSPELAEPLTASRLDMVLMAPPAPKGLAWRIDLANPEDPGTETLVIEGTYNHRALPGTSADLVTDITGVRWRVAAKGPGAVARGRFDGKVQVAQKGGAWRLSGDARVLELDASGPALSGDRLRLDAVKAGWEVVQADEGWQVKRLDLASAVATLSATGALNAPPGTSTRIEGEVDLAALTRQLPRALRLRDGLTLERGMVRAKLDLRSEAGGQRLDAEAHVSDLVARDASRTFTLREPATLSAQVSRTGSDIRVGALALKSPFLDATGKGDLDRGVTLNATFDLAGLQANLRQLIDFGGIELAGKGKVAAEYKRNGEAFSGRFAAETLGLHVVGLLNEPLHRDALRVEAAVAGPITPTGLPSGWTAARFGLKGGDIEASVSGTSREGVISATATAKGPAHVAGRDVLADARAVVRWQGQAVAFDEARLFLAPPGPKATEGLLRVSATGKYDMEKGELMLLPPAGDKPEPVSVAADGLKVTGLGKGSPGIGVSGGLVADLAGLDRVLAGWDLSARRDLAGVLTARLSAVRGEGGRLDFNLNVDSPDLSLPAGDGPRRHREGPINLAAKGTYLADTDRVAFEALSLATPYASLDATGSLVEPSGRRVADLAGNLSPNWETLSAIVATVVEPKARVKGRARPFHVRGPLSAESTAALIKGLDAEVGIDFTGALAFGMLVGPAPVVLKCSGGNLEILPISTTLNGGKVELSPELLVDDAGAGTLRLAPGASIERAEINDDVSTRVLSYIAPVLHQATQVRGFVSVKLDRAEIPLWGGGDRGANINGVVRFADVVYGPGTLAREILSLTGKGDNLGLRLNEDVKIAVADGRVAQEGLAVDLGNEVKVDLSGSVGFDQSLRLRAAVPITPAMLGNQAALREIVGGAKVGVPIAGTMTRPVIDRQAVRVALKEQGREIVKRGVSREANQLLDRFAGPRGNAAQPGANAGARGASGLGDSLKGELRGLGEDALRGLINGGRGGRR